MAGLAALVLLGAAGTVAALALTGSSDDEPAALTREQAELLAMVRFNNYQAATGTFEATVPVQGATVELRGAVDWRRHVGTATIQAMEGSAQGGSGLVQWSFSAVGFRPGVVGPDAPVRLPRRGWSYRPLDPGAMPVDAVLALLLNLATDRPENPQLLSQNGAVKLGEDTVNGAPVQVFSGPRQAGESDSGSGAPSENGAEPRLRYWIDETGRLRRLVARIGEEPDPATIDFDLSADRKVAVSSDLAVPDAGSPRESRG